jgi:hypothetical protein
VSGTIEAEDDGLAPHSSPGCRLTRLDWWSCYGWDSAGVPGGRPNAEPGAGSAVPGAPHSGAALIVLKH